MTTQEQKKLAAHIIRLLKVRSVSFPIAKTDKGDFSIKYTGDSDYEMVLDAVPLITKNKFDDENNIELKAVLEKYWFEKEKIANNVEYKDFVRPIPTSDYAPKIIVEKKQIQANYPKKKGRPAKVK